MVAGAILSAKLLKKGISGSLMIISGIILTLISGVSLLLIISLSNYHSAWLFFFLTTILFFASSFVYPSASYAASNSISCKSNASGMMNFINMSIAAIMVTTLGLINIPNFLKFSLGLIAYAILSAFLLLIALKGQIALKND